MTAAIANPSRQVVLRGVSWGTYRALVRDLVSEPGKRLTYDQGILEIMVSLPSHKSYKRLLGRMVEVTTEAIEFLDDKSIFRLQGFEANTESSR